MSKLVDVISEDIRKRDSIGLFLLSIVFFSSYFFLSDFGTSFDTFINNRNGLVALHFYSGGMQPEVFFSRQNVDDQFYGPVLDAIIVAFAGLTNDEVHAQFIRSLLQYSISGSVIFAIYLIIRHFVSDKRAALASLVIFFTPSLFGHAVINPKDGPFASLFLWSLYLCIVSRKGAGAFWALLILAGILTGLASSIRYLGALLVALYGLYIFFEKFQTGKFWRSVLRAFVDLSLWFYFAISLASYILFMPYVLARRNPMALIEVFQKFANYPWVGNVRYFGDVASTALPWHYVLGMLVSKMPLVYHFSVMVILIYLFWKFVDNPLKKRLFANFKFGKLWPEKAVLVSSWLLPLFLFVSLHPVLYDGLRHFLFIVPLLGISLAIGLFSVLDRLSSKQFVAVCVAGAFLVIQQFGALVRLHPYEYIYTNPLVSAKNNLELDYWGLSFKEVAEYINLHEPLGPPDGQGYTIYVCGPSESLRPYLNYNNYRVVWESDKLPIDQPYMTAAINRANCLEDLGDGKLLYSVTRRDLLLSELRIVDRGQE